jgi:hypothetical protein
MPRPAEAAGQAAIRAEALIVVQVHAGAGADIEPAHGLLGREAEAVHHRLGIRGRGSARAAAPSRRVVLKRVMENILGCEIQSQKPGS